MRAPAAGAARYPAWAASRGHSAPGEAVALAGKYVPHFKPGKDLRERVNAGQSHPIRD